MKKLRHLFIAFAISTLLAATTFAGDMHSDSKNTNLPPAPQTAQTTPTPPDEEGYIEIVVETVNAVLDFLPFL
jgi:hypothetical protein